MDSEEVTSCEREKIANGQADEHMESLARYVILVLYRSYRELWFLRASALHCVFCVYATTFYKRSRSDSFCQVHVFICFVLIKFSRSNFQLRKRNSLRGPSVRRSVMIESKSGKTSVLDTLCTLCCVRWELGCGFGLDAPTLVGERIGNAL